MASSDSLALRQDTAAGLRNLDQIVDRLGLDGVYGPLYKLFEVGDKYALAVEETAGARCVQAIWTANRLCFALRR